ncbi:P-loop NTPase fold protein [Undibacterium sp.]|uniref:P-loop NTPase fold protein n=1 Tax=Undibacterium sp. TaxID=1914977 RepID=UPI002C7A8DD7|nr:P-loop NTPase fold protein [Undibacterium sp.]HTD06807.1 P-loop NTPase fold protein [Undibacterium sp.]
MKFHWLMKSQRNAFFLIEHWLEIPRTHSGEYMSLKSTKEQFVQLLTDNDNKVIALSGRWGTGKSFMWDKVKNSSEDDRIKGALYASLFGLSTIEQIKMKLIQSAIPSMKASPALWKGSKDLAKTGIKALTGIHKSFEALNDLGLVFAPAMLRQRLIVLDDIERKHDKLDIDEVLGFIDDFTQQHGSRFVLILNSDQLDKRDVWDTLREKVVDQELKLTTSSAEAFEIAVGLQPSIYADQIRAAVEICELTNIRIIRKIIKSVNRILGDREGLTDAVISRVIPSTVLLSAIHYKGIEDGPNFDFVLAQGAAHNWGAFLEKKDSESEENRRQSKWKLLINKLGISSCDEFELLVVEFLESGLFDVSKVAEIIDGYVAEADRMHARDEYHKFFQRCVWDHTLTEEQLLAQASEVAEKSPLLDPYTVTALHETVMGIPGGEVVAEAAVTRWIEAFKAKNPQETELNNFWHHKLHPRIEAEFQAINAKVQANTSAFDACVHISRNSGWGTRQEVAMKAATAQDMENLIRHSDIESMRHFMLKMQDLCINKKNYEKHFGSAMDNFVQACKTIVEDPQSGRLRKLIKLLFDDSKITHLLLNQPEAQAVGAPVATPNPNEA